MGKMEQFLQMLNAVLSHLSIKEQDTLLFAVKDSENMISNFLNIAKS